MVSENINIAPHHPCERSHSHRPSTYTRRDFSDDSSDESWIIQRMRIFKQ